MNNNDSMNDSEEPFVARMLGILNDAALAMMLSIGHQTGLFDTIARLEPSTSQEIAEAGGLNERYVREWLGAMVTGGILEFQASSGCYRMPSEHARFLTREATINNLATRMQYFSELGRVEQQVATCFREGGGVPYSQYAGFEKLASEQDAQVFDARLINSILPLADGLIERLQEGIEVADIGCGAGHALNLMAAAFPKSRFTGFDFSRASVAEGEAEARRLTLKNAHFVVFDLAMQGEAAAFDAITAFDVVHDLAQPQTVLNAVHKSLRPGGVFVCVEPAASSNLEENLDHPLGSFLYSVSTLYCMPVSLAQGGAGLGTVAGEEKCISMLDEAGFGRADVKKVEDDRLHNYYIAWR